MAWKGELKMTLDKQAVTGCVSESAKSRLRDDGIDRLINAQIKMAERLNELVARIEKLEADHDIT